MKLYASLTSPYARIARIVRLEKKLEARVEVVVPQTRRPGSPYYLINPSGRIPYLVREDGVGLEGSKLISTYLDHLDGSPAFEPSAGAPAWEADRLESLARSTLDGLAVWLREMARPADERSPTVLAHEIARAGRLIDAWEREIGHAWMNGEPNRAQITLGSALGLETRIDGFGWRTDHPALRAWFDRLMQRPAFSETTPPPRSTVPPTSVYHPTPNSKETTM